MSCSDDLGVGCGYDSRLLEHCTDRQVEILVAFWEEGSYTAAGKKLGIHRSTVARTLTAVREKAALDGYAPGHFANGTAPGYQMGKVTIQRGALGNVERTWERQSPSEEALIRAIRQTVDSLSEKILPIDSVERVSRLVKENLATLYTLTDYHVGMLAWHKEGGADWDLDIAERMGVAALHTLIQASPNSHTAIINIQGDFLHFDGMTPVTPTSGHVLDADSRFGKVLDVAIRLIRRLVAMALEKHEHVILLVAEGNHDLNSTLILSRLFRLFYENEPRIEVIDNAIPYYAIEWGYTLIGVHHGHMKKNEALPALFAAQFREQWGRAKHTVIHTGHYHHLDVTEYPGAIVIRHPTLAARDAYASRHGYWSERAMLSNTYDKDVGEIMQNRVTPRMIGM